MRFPLRIDLSQAATSRLVGTLAAAAFCTAFTLPARGQDLWITPADPSEIRVNVIADPQCPITCGDAYTPCCQTFAANIAHMNTRIPDLTMLNGDLTIDSHDQVHVDQFLDLWGDVLGEKHFVLGNHEADPHENFTWVDPADHYVPAVQYEPLFGHGTPEYRRWYSIYIGSPPRVAVFALNNCSDSFSDDEVCYLFCTQPMDSLNHAGSSQRTWLNAEIDALPSTVQAVLVCVHRTYYGVENYLCRPNVYYSATNDFHTAPQETLRTGSVSLLRDLESIPSRTQVQRVIVASGDQHCFAITHPIRMNQRDDEDGIPYIVLGGGGAKNHRSANYPNLNKVPPGVYKAGLDDKWFNTTFRFTQDEIEFSVHEAYTDSLLHRSSWPLTPSTGVPDETLPFEVPTLSIYPNPVILSRRGNVSIAVQGNGAGSRIDRLSVYDISGRRVRRLSSRGTPLPSGAMKTWDARDDAGRLVGPGVYLVCARLGKDAVTEKITVLK